MKIYIASSWRNKHQPAVVKRLRQEGYFVYDFRDPDGAGKDSGFHWSQLDPKWESWTAEQFRDALNHPIAVEHFKKDFDAMKWADALVMVMPCGRSAHFEAGWATGKKPTVVLLLGPDAEPELMYLQASLIAISVDEVIDWLSREETWVDAASG